MFIDADRDFYHLVGPMLEVGSIIKKGNYGRIIKKMGWQHNCSYRERLLEMARLEVEPTAPSRLDCIFAFLNCTDAMLFRNRNQGFITHVLCKVRPLDVKCAAFVCDYTHVDPLITNRPELWPQNYWMRVGTETQQNFPNPEVLIFSDLRIEEIIE